MAVRVHLVRVEMRDMLRLIRIGSWEFVEIEIGFDEVDGEMEDELRDFRNEQVVVMVKVSDWADANEGTQYMSERRVKTVRPKGEM